MTVATASFQPHQANTLIFYVQKIYLSKEKKYILINIDVYFQYKQKIKYFMLSIEILK
jgi:hypothetical protein